METLEQVRRHSSMELEQGIQPFTSVNADVGSSAIISTAAQPTMPSAGLASFQAQPFGYNNPGFQFSGVVSATLSSDGGAVAGRPESTTSSLSDDSSTKALLDGPLELKLQQVQQLLALQQRVQRYQFEGALNQANPQANEKQTGGIVSNGDTNKPSLSGDSSNTALPDLIQQLLALQQRPQRSPLEEALIQANPKADEKQKSGTVSNGSTYQNTQGATTHPLMNSVASNIQQSTSENIATQNVTTQAYPSYQVNNIMPNLHQNSFISPSMNPVQNLLHTFGNCHNNHANVHNLHGLPTTTNPPMNATALNPQQNTTLNDSLLSFLLNRIGANPNQSKEEVVPGK